MSDGRPRGPLFRALAPRVFPGDPERTGRARHLHTILWATGTEGELVTTLEAAVRLSPPRPSPWYDEAPDYAASLLAEYRHFGLVSRAAALALAIAPCGGRAVGTSAACSASGANSRNSRDRRVMPGLR